MTSVYFLDLTAQLVDHTLFLLWIPLHARVQSLSILHESVWAIYCAINICEINQISIKFGTSLRRHFAKFGTG